MSKTARSAVPPVTATTSKSTSSSPRMSWSHHVLTPPVTNG
ncbi:hypothetical protein REH70_03645 [Cellulomonas sp. ATA003]|nr:hypothetical protein [Cellulomonas sp. ATA003]WNB86354.1 hypothetical protein REH70_03645 [Cellulomonas sp. ATA003]